MIRGSNSIYHSFIKSPPRGHPKGWGALSRHSGGYLVDTWWRLGSSTKIPPYFPLFPSFDCVWLLHQKSCICFSHFFYLYNLFIFIPILYFHIKCNPALQDQQCFSSLLKMATYFFSSSPAPWWTCNYIVTGRLE